MIMCPHYNPNLTRCVTPTLPAPATDAVSSTEHKMMEPGAPGKQPALQTRRAFPFRAWLAATKRRLVRWWTWQTICAWCEPHRRIAGAPWARHVTHGMCDDCFDSVRREIEARNRNRHVHH